MKTYQAKHDKAWTKRAKLIHDLNTRQECTDTAPTCLAAHIDSCTNICGGKEIRGCVLQDCVCVNKRDLRCVPIGTLFRRPIVDDLHKTRSRNSTLPWQSSWWQSDRWAHTLRTLRHRHVLCSFSCRHCIARPSAVLASQNHN